MGNRNSGRKGWGEYEDLSGKRFGRWTVLKRVENNQWEQMMYLCECDCGWIGRTQARALRSGISKSCGCLKNELAAKRIKKLWAEGAFTK